MGGGFELGTEDSGFAGVTGGFCGLEVGFRVEEMGEAVNDRPEVCGHAKEGVHGVEG